MDIRAIVKGKYMLVFKKKSAFEASRWSRRLLMSMLGVAQYFEYTLLRESIMQNRLFQVSTGLFLALTLAIFPALADEIAGVVKNAKGSVAILRNNTVIAASPGAVILVADQISTGKDGSLGITMKDDTLLSYGPNSIIKLDNFNFDSTTHEGNILLSMIKGSMVFVTGLIGKKSPQKVSIKIPNATIGIRGTEFVVEVEGE